MTETTSKTGHSVSGSQGAVIVATTLAVEFSEYFADRPGATVFVFDSGKAAFEAWRSTQAEFFFCDYAGLADGMTGFRLIKTIRAVDPNPAAVHIFFMSEKTQTQEQLDLLKSLGVRDTVQKTPEAVERVISSGRPRIQKASAAAVNGFAHTAPLPSGDVRLASIENLFHQFVGPVASRLIEIVRREQIDPFGDPRQYVERLAARIKTPEMRQSFLDAAQRRLSA
jgi:CheY-like chemotaxis protein